MRKRHCANISFQNMDFKIFFLHCTLNGEWSERRTKKEYERDGKFLVITLPGK